MKTIHSNGPTGFVGKSWKYPFQCRFVGVTGPRCRPTHCFHSCDTASPVSCNRNACQLSSDEVDWLPELVLDGSSHKLGCTLE